MSQDVVADALNQILNAIKAKKDFVVVNRHSKLLTAVLALAKLKGYIKDYQLEGKSLRINIEKLNACQAIKPRFAVNTDEIPKYVSRYLPARDIGMLVVSTSKGIMAHTTAMEKNIGGSLIAYFY